MELHAPQITTEFCVDLPQDVDEDSVVVFRDRLRGHELRDHGRVRVNLALYRRVEQLLPDGVGHDNQKDVAAAGVFLLLLFLTGLAFRGSDFVVVKLLNGLLEVVHVGAVVKRDDPAVINVDAKSLLLRDVIELVLDVLGVFNVPADAENGPRGEFHGLVHNL